MNIKRNYQFKALSIKIFGCIFLSSFISAQAQQIFKEHATSIETSYLESRRELDDYILDTGDTLDINFVGVPDFKGSFTIDAQGEIYFPGDEDIKEVYVRGLTVSELEDLLEKKFKNIIITPKINIKISTFKPIRILIRGEVRDPGLITFDAIKVNKEENIIINESMLMQDINNSQNLNSNSSKRFSTTNIKRKNNLVSTLSNAIRKAGGLTSYSDVSQIEIIRDIPISKGGGKKRAVINFETYLKESDNSYDIRLFDGDSIRIASLQV